MNLASALNLHAITFFVSCLWFLPFTLVVYRSGLILIKLPHLPAASSTSNKPSKHARNINCKSEVPTDSQDHWKLLQLTCFRSPYQAHPLHRQHIVYVQRGYHNCAICRAVSAPKTNAGGTRAHLQACRLRAQLVWSEPPIRRSRGRATSHLQNCPTRSVSTSLRFDE